MSLMGAKLPLLAPREDWFWAAEPRAPCLLQAPVLLQHGWFWGVSLGLMPWSLINLPLITLMSNWPALLFPPIPALPRLSE